MQHYPVMTIEEERKRWFRTEQDKAVINILYSSEKIKTSINQLLKPYGLRLEEWDVLRILLEFEHGPISLSTLRERTLCNRRSLGKILYRFKEDGLICEEPVFSNGIENAYFLTSDARQLVERIDYHYQSLLDHYRNSISQGEARLLNNVLDKTRSLSS